MNKNYQDALDGKLASEPLGKVMPVALWNNQVVDIRLVYLTPLGTQASMGVVPSGFTAVLEVVAGDYIMVLSNPTGSFMGVITITSETTSVYFGPNYLVAPNAIGSMPKPTQDKPIPPSPPRIMVAGGTLANGNIVIREQQWMRQANSVSMMPGQKQDTNITTTTGFQQTSSATSTISTSIGADASAGWGPYSASVSASLSSDSTSFQQVDVSSETTLYQADHINGDRLDYAAYYLKWALMDTIMVLSSKQESLSSSITTQAPILIDGPYSLSKLEVEAKPSASEGELMIGFPRSRRAWAQRVEARLGA